jgi:hypothetical protein
MSSIMAYLKKHEDSAYVTAELLAAFAGHERAVKSDLARSLERKGVDRVFFAEPEFDAARFLYHYRAFGFEIIYEGIE